MPVVTSHAPGTFCWFELATTDIAAARRFYMDLFGWSMREDPTGVAPYTMFRIDGQDVAAGYTLMKEQLDAGVGPHWMHYVSVTDAAETAAKAAEQGGTVLMGPLDVMDVGRMAVIRDPQGATLSVWQPLKHCGVGRSGEPNTHCWSELAARDAAAAERFYTAVLPWSAAHQAMGPVDYVMWMRGETPAGGMLQMDEQWGEAPPAWTIYFAVDDCDAKVGQAVALGARLVVPASQAAGVGRMAVLADPQGALFSIIKLDA